MGGRSEPGKLLIIGGAEDKEDKCVILNELIGLAGGKESKVVIITTATQNPDDVGQDYVAIFNRLGVTGTRVLDIRSWLAFRSAWP